MMSAIPYNLQEISKWRKIEKTQKQKVVEGSNLEEISSIDTSEEATSTLDTTKRSPSSPASFSTHSCGKNNPDLISGFQNRLESTSSLHCGLELEEWDNMFPNGDGGALLPWLMCQNENDYQDNGGNSVGGSGFDNLIFPCGVDNVVDLGFNGSGFGSNGKLGSVLNNCNLLSSSTSSGNVGNVGGGGLNFSHLQQFDDVGDEKDSQLVMNQYQAHGMVGNGNGNGNPSFLMPQLGGYTQLEQHVFPPQAKRHNPGVVVLDTNIGSAGHELLFRKQQLNMQQMSSMGLVNQLVPQHIEHKPLMVQQQQHHHHHQQLLQQHQYHEQAVKDQLFKAGDMIQTGNFSLAEEILARLNHHLSLPAKPLIRAALYLKEALQMILLMNNPVAAPPSKSLTPYDVVHKMNAYKVLSEVSPITQFVNFTCTQAILEALDDVDAIHIIDFDIGFGAQWASFIQELPLRKKGPPSLKITALASPSTSHPFELGLIRDNLVQFASDVGIVFDFQVVNLDLFDPTSSSMPNIRTCEDEAIAVSIPIWSSSNRPSVLPSILRFIKQRSPKIVVSFDRGFDRFDVPFPQHLIQTLESCTSYLESLDGLSVAPDIVNKIEKYFIQPMVENTVLGRVHAPDKMPHWKNLFASAGFIPLQFSNFTETQADYVVKRTPGRGFHVEKRQASLVLSWQRRELVAASAWRCC